jgi:hypothetical protein
MDSKVRIAAYKTKDLKSALIDFTPSVRDNAYNNLFPSFRAPRLRTCTTTKMTNILNDAISRKSY